MGNTINYRKAREYETWPKTYELDQDTIEIVKVRCEKDIQDAVKRAGDTNVGVRAMGSQYSWEKIVEPTERETGKGIVLDLKYYNKILHVNKEKKLVQVEGGMKVKDLNKALDFHGLAMSDLGNVDGQTVAGVVSTGTHGEQVNGGCLSTLMKRIWIVNGLGVVKEIDMEKKNSDTAAAVGVSMGLLGVISRIEFKVEEAFDLMQETRYMETNDFLENLPKLVANNEYIQLFYVPHVDGFAVDLSNRVPKDDEKNAEFRGYTKGEMKLIRAYSVLSSYFGVKPFVSVMESQVRPALIKEPKRLTSSSAISNGTSLLLDHYELEGTIPLSQFKPFLLELKELYKQNGLPTYPIDMRTIQGDNFFLSRAYGTEPVIWIDFLAPKLRRVGKFMGGKSVYEKEFKLVIPLMKKYKAKFHWGKINGGMIGTDYTAAQFTEIEKFNRVRAKMDPKGIFAQTHVDALLNGTKPTTVVEKPF